VPAAPGTDADGDGPASRPTAVSGGLVRAVTRSAAAVAAIAAALATTVWPTAVAAGSPVARPPLIGYVLAGQTNKLDRLDPATDRMLPPISLSWAPDAMAIAPAAGRLTC
jgi:hypothetical protein